MSEEQRRQLQQQLWNIANTLRGKMGADEFRDYILGFIFYKYLSEKIQRFADAELAQENLKFTEINETSAEGKAYIDALEEAALSELGYFLKPSEMFHAIAMKGSNQLDTNGQGDSHNFILGDLTKILKNIEQSTLGTDSADDFVNLFEDLDLTSSKLGKTEKEKNDLVAKVLVHLDKIDFNLSDSTADVLGDAYEYLIGEFASGAGKKAGEFYTPQPVSTLLAKLVTTNNKKLKSVYDPTCGSGSLLLRVKREASAVDKIYGQELNRTTYNLARMNMILHDVHYADFDIKQEDTLERPQHRDLRFDAIVANPPFSAQWSASQLHMNDDRFSVYGKLAPSSKADMAFVQHMVYQLAEEGTMAVVLPHGVLFRGSSEGQIRQYLIEQLNCLDAVIGLPSNMFYGATISTVILVFKKCRKNPDNILFIDASQHFEKVKTAHVMRSENIQKIVDAYKARSDEDKYSHVASMEEIKANEYNLNIPRYIDTFEDELEVDIEKVVGHLKETKRALDQVDEKLKPYCDELNIPIPDGYSPSLLKEYKKGLLQKIFTQKISFKKNGESFPPWQNLTLGQVATLKRGGVLSKSDIEDNGAIECIHYGELFTTYNEVITDVKSRTNHSDGVLSKAFDILMPSSDVTPTGLAKACCIVKGGVVLGGDINIVRTNERVSPVFLSYLLNYEKKKIMRLVSGSSVKHIYTSDLKNISYLMPTSIEEQNIIAKFFALIDEKIGLSQTSSS